MVRRCLIGLAAVLLPLTSTGCIVVFSGSRVWTPGETERLPLDTSGLSALEIKTHNGSITFEGQSGNAAEAYVDVTTKAGGRSAEDAEEALAAIDVYIEPSGSGTQRVGWRWAEPKRRGWNAKVSFDIHAPGDIRVQAISHNGALNVRDVVGDVNLITHNGGIDVESSGGKLNAVTHNGRIRTEYVGENLNLTTHNGGVVVDLTGSRVVDGFVTTHNGGVNVTVDETTSARLLCRTHNGGIRCDAPLTQTTVSRRRLTGTLGSGEGALKVTTHNGGIRIKQGSG